MEKDQHPTRLNRPVDLTVLGLDLTPQEVPAPPPLAPLSPSQVRLRASLVPKYPRVTQGPPGLLIVSLTIAWSPNFGSWSPTGLSATVPRLPCPQGIRGMNRAQKSHQVAGSLEEPNY